MKIATVAVSVDNQQEALKFWTGKLGFLVHGTETMTSELNWIEIGPEGAESYIVLYPKSLMKDWNERKPSVMFECDYLDHEYNRLMADPGRATPLGN